MNENGTNKKLILGIVVVMFLLLIPITFMMFMGNGQPAEPTTNPVIQNPTTQPVSIPTTAPTTQPTVIPTTQPVNPQGCALSTDKQSYTSKESVLFQCVSLNGNGTLWIYAPDGTSTPYQNVSISIALKFSVPGTYNARYIVQTENGSVQSDLISFVVVVAPTQTPATKKPTVKPTTAAPTTAKPTTAAPTVAPTTAKPTTAAPTTAKPTTAAPTTAKPTTAKPTTAKPTTAAPTTAKPTTAKPTTAAPTTAKPTTAPTTKPTVDMNGTFYITESGAGKATIVVSENYTDKALEAANDLYDYIWRISGAELDFIFDDGELEQDRFYILVGPTKFHKNLGIEVPKGYPNNEKLIVQRKGNVLALVGNDDGAFTGTQFAVTRFLEELGCGWFAPETNPLWTVVPENDTITIEDMNIVETPKFISRSNRLMTFNAHSANLAKRWYMGGVETLVGQHFLMAYVDVQTYLSTNPEWYAKYSNGSYKDAGWWQFCYSNSSLHQKVADVISQYFDSHPNCMVFSIAANDGSDIGICECSKCRTYSSDTDLMIDFANGVAKLLKSKYPDRQLNILSYAPTVFAPASNHYLESNVELMLCAETIVTKPISQATTVGMHAWRRNITWMSNAQNYISRTNAKHVSAWKWLCIAANDECAAWANIPWVQGNVATMDHDTWKSLGCTYVFYDQGPHSAYREYDNSFPLRWPLWYVANRACWTQGKTGEQILQEACDKLYGAGSSAMMSYYKALANASSACNSSASVSWVMCSPKEVYTAAQIQTIDRRIAACKQMLSQVTADQAKRMQNQISLWETAKASYIK